MTQYLIIFYFDLESQHFESLDLVFSIKWQKLACMCGFGSTLDDIALQNFAQKFLCARLVQVQPTQQPEHTARVTVKDCVRQHKQMVWNPTGPRSQQTSHHRRVSVGLQEQ